MEKQRSTSPRVPGGSFAGAAGHRRLLRRRRHGLRRDQPRVALAAGGDRDDRDPGPAR